MTASEDDQIAAAECAFGLLDPADRAAADERASRDPSFRALVGWWQERAVALFAGSDETPPPSLWPRIAGRLAANDTAPGTSTATAVRRWQVATALASIAAIALGVIALRPAPPPPPPRVAASAPPLVAMLVTDDGQPELAVMLDRTGRLTTTPAALSVGEHAAELWVIPADGRPRSLGVVATARPEWRPAPARVLPAIGPGATLAVSEEPTGGSPTGQPTGAVILTGKVTAI